jgi:lipid-binding SYLF domain-containing protein
MRRATFLREALLAAALLVALLPAAPRPAFAQAEAQALVDRSTLTVTEMLGDDAPGVQDAVALLRRARAVLICPRIFRAGFIFAGQGGPCVLMARDGAGSWSSPAFYTMGSGSIGLQAGLQDMQVMMMIMNERALNAVLDSQLTLGADAAMTIATLGGGVEGATTTALGADIVTFSRTRGLFAGVSLNGSVIATRSAYNREFYGRDISGRQIVVDMAAHNPGADPLRGALMRFSSR